jgi:hypothetical protein
MMGCWCRKRLAENGEYAGSCLILLFSVALRSVVFCIRAEYADVVQVLVAVGWWCVVVWGRGGRVGCHRHH